MIQKFTIFLEDKSFGARTNRKIELNFKLMDRSAILNEISCEEQCVGMMAFSPCCLQILLGALLSLLLTMWNT